MAIQENIVAPVITELAKGNQGFLEIWLHGGGTCAVVEGDGKVTEVQGSVVGRLHDLSIGDTNAQTMGSRHFVQGVEGVTRLLVQPESSTPWLGEVGTRVVLIMLQ